MNKSKFRKFSDGEDKTLKARVKASKLFDRHFEIVSFFETTLAKVSKATILPSTGVELIIQFLGQIVDEASHEVNSTDLLALVEYTIRPESAEFLTLLLNIQHRFNNINEIMNEIEINVEPRHMVADFIKLEIDILKEASDTSTFGSFE